LYVGQAFGWYGYPPFVHGVLANFLTVFYSSVFVTFALEFVHILTRFSTVAIIRRGFGAARSSYTYYNDDYD
jgi:hypothetical protein